MSDSGQFDNLLLKKQIDVSFSCDISRKTMFDHISKHREERWKYNVQRSIFDELQGVWNCDQTLSLVFDISSQSNLKLRRKWRNKIVKIYAN